MTQNLYLINIYNPANEKINSVMISDIVDKLNGLVVVAGYLNCHHSLWGTVDSNYNRQEQIKIMNNNNLVLLNDGSPIRILRPGENISAVDITLVSNNIALF